MILKTMLLYFLVQVCYDYYLEKDKNMKKLLLPLALAVALLLTGCEDKKPANVTPVENFKLTEYLGTWYEIARLEHRFEKGMEAISATYSMREDGGVKVLNKGYKTAEKEWSDRRR